MSTTEPSLWRKFLNDVLMPSTAPTMGKFVIDVGKTLTWDYRPYFKPGVYTTLDRNPETKPHILLDLEKDTVPDRIVKAATGVICNGVYEQCSDPSLLRIGLEKISAKDSIILFGAPCLMPLYGVADKWRITPDGIREYLKAWTPVFEKSIPFDSQYCFFVGRKK